MALATDRVPPEIDHWRSLDTKAFNGDNAIGLPGNKNYTG